jgi:hypothetical protein
MAPPRGTALSRCRDENRIAELETNASRESLTLSTTDVVDVAELSATGKVTVGRKGFLSCRMRTIQLSFSSAGRAFP